MTAITHQEGIETSRQLTATVVREMEVKTANEKPIQEVDQNHHQTRRIWRTTIIEDQDPWAIMTKKNKVSKNEK